MTIKKHILGDLEVMVDLGILNQKMNYNQDLSNTLMFKEVV
jgi:hypothetical protein